MSTSGTSSSFRLAYRLHGEPAVAEGSDALLETVARLDGGFVLVVDDEAHNEPWRGHILNLVRCSGLAVLAVPDIESANRALRARSPHLLMLDCGLEEGDQTLGITWAEARPWGAHPPRAVVPFTQFLLDDAEIARLKAIDSVAKVLRKGKAWDAVLDEGVEAAQIDYRQVATAYVVSYDDSLGAELRSPAWSADRSFRIEPGSLRFGEFESSFRHGGAAGSQRVLVKCKLNLGARSAGDTRPKILSHNLVGGIRQRLEDELHPALGWLADDLYGRTSSA